MFDRSGHSWVSDCTDKELLRWCKESANAEKPEAKFLRASELLAEYRQGSEAAEAVLLMEQAAKEEYPPAVFALGQMFQWGWAVHKDKKRAMELYRQAAALGYGPAAKLLAEAKRRKIIAVASVCAAALACVLAAGLIFRWFQQADPRTVILVHSDTQLIEAVTLEEFTGGIQAMVADYDDELVISGQVSTNRVILRFEGNRLDLSGFLADRVVSWTDNLVVIQFSSEAEAQRCLEELSRMSAIVFAEMDEYVIMDSDMAYDVSSARAATIPKDFNAPYYSWGVADMGLDQLSAYVAQNCSDRSLIVAVVDTGAVPGSEFANRFLPGYNAATGGNVVPQDHGTHVAGTIADGTRGTNIRLVSIDVFNGNESASVLVKYTGIQYAVTMNVDVINLSMGGSAHSKLSEDGLKLALDAGIVVVQAAGNENTDTQNACPSELDGPIVVAAYDENHDLAWFTNYGSSVDVAAPGVGIYSQYYLDDSYLLNLQGTSMATPHVSALAALVKMIYPDATPAQVELYIKDYGRNTNAAYDTGLYGAGAADASAFVEVIP